MRKRGKEENGLIRGRFTWNRAAGGVLRDFAEELTGPETRECQTADPRHLPGYEQRVLGNWRD